MGNHTFLGNIDLSKFQLLNAAIQNLASAPSSPAVGQIYFDTGDSTFYGWDGAQWVALGSIGGGGGGIETVAVASANGFTGSSDDDPTDPTLTIGTSVSGLLKGNGTAVSAAVSGTDFAPATSGTGALKGDGSGGFGAATINDLGSQTADYSANSHKITNLATPTNSADAATKAYVDALSQGLDFKSSVRVIVTTNGTLATAYKNGASAGGVTLATGDRILLAGQTTGSENGFYTVNASGAPTRATDADASGEISKGAIVYVEAGTNAGQLWVCSATASTPWVPGSDSSTWTQFGGAADIVAGNGLTKSGNTLAVGAGTGMVANADDMAIDTSVVVRKYAADIGDGSSTTIAITHSLGTRDVTVAFYDNSTHDAVFVPYTCNSTSQITADFGSTAPASSAYRVVVHA
jgi:hypothetical protein